MAEPTVRAEVDGAGVATVWLHRPHRRNAFIARMHADLRAVFAQFQADERVRLAVITGTPPAFSVGGDAQALGRHAERGDYEGGVPADAIDPVPGARPELAGDLVWLAALRFPVIAAVNGACAGIALALACWCDLRFAAAGAKLTTAAPRLGLPAEYGLSWTLPRLVGPTHAADLLLSGRVFPAEEAPPGLFNAVVPADQLAGHVGTYARRLATEASPVALAMTKRQLWDDLLRADPAASVAESQRLIGLAMGTPDFTEGVAALREKRPPRF